MSEALTVGCYYIMRKLSGYRIEHFLRDDFYSSQYFLLIDLINEEQKEQNKAMKEAKKKNN